MDALLQLLAGLLDKFPSGVDGFLGGLLGAIVWTFIHDRWQVVRRQRSDDGSGDGV